MIIEAIENTGRYQTDAIVCMTSWPDRIENVEQTVRSLYNGLFLPKKVVLTLCEPEFVETAMPYGLQELINSGKVEVNWIQKNLKAFKRFIPFIARFTGNENTWVVMVDDDKIYGEKFLFHLVMKSMIHPNSVISPDIYPCGYGCLVKPRFFKDKYLWCGLNQEMCDYIIFADVWVWANLQANKVTVCADSTLIGDIKQTNDINALNCDYYNRLPEIRKYVSDVFKQRNILVDLRFKGELKPLRR